MEFTRNFPDKPGHYFVKFHETAPTEIVLLEYCPEEKEGFTAQDMEEDWRIEEHCWPIWRHGLNDDMCYREDFLWGERIEMP